MLLCNYFKQGVQTMNTELIIKAVNAVIEFNQKNTDFEINKTVMSASLEIRKYNFCCSVFWGWNDTEFTESYIEYSDSDEVLQQFINKLQELSQ